MFFLDFYVFEKFVSFFKCDLILRYYKGGEQGMIIESMPACPIGDPQFSVDGKTEERTKKEAAITTITALLLLSILICLRK